MLELLLTIAPVGSFSALQIGPVLYMGASYSRFWATRTGDGGGESFEVNVPGLTLGTCVEIRLWRGKALLDLSYTVAVGSGPSGESGLRSLTTLLGYAIVL